MKLKGLGSMLLVAVVLVGGLSWSSYGQKAAAPEKAWEYKIEREYSRDVPLGAKEISEYGSQGWELVAVTTYGSQGEKTFYFKRAR